MFKPDGMYRPKKRNIDTVQQSSSFYHIHQTLKNHIPKTIIDRNTI